jgi:tRNA threonylcarbamoyl adenosine modification protein YeaZ
MKCLAINTATKVLSIAIVDDGKTLYLYETPELRDQGNLLLTYIKKGLTENKLDFHDIDLLAAVTGPGSFTGIRIGLSTMRGISLAADKPLIGITSFEMFAAMEQDAVNIIAIESWREELYFAALDGKGNPLVEPANETPEVFSKHCRHYLPPGKKIIVSGDAKETAAAFFPGAILTKKDANAEDVARLAARQFKKGQPLAKASPHYLREADVTISSKPVHTLKDEIR